MRKSNVLGFTLAAAGSVVLAGLTGREVAKQTEHAKPIILEFFQSDIGKGIAGSRSQYEEILQARNYKVIGVQLGNARQYLTAVNIWPNSPADKAGVMPGDVITSVCGKSTRRMTPANFKEVVRQTKGDSITITTVRDDTNLTHLISFETPPQS